MGLATSSRSLHRPTRGLSCGQETPAAPPSPTLTQPCFSSSQNVTANHRINDALANEDGPQVLAGRFMYGPLDMVTLTGEKVRTRGRGRSPGLTSLWLGCGTGKARDMACL